MQEWSPFRAYGSKPGPFCWPNLLTLAVIFGGAAWLYIAACHLPGYSWNWESCLGFFYTVSPQGDIKPGLLLKGLQTTLRVGLWTFLCSLAIGGSLGLLANYKPSLVSLPYQLIVNLLRNTPPLIILFCVYFLTGNVFSLNPLVDAVRSLPPAMQGCITCLLGNPGQFDSMFAAVFALGLYQSAYVAEIIRGSMESVPRMQWEAGIALGFSRSATLRLIILPQGLRLALPPLTGQCISTFKESSLASLISLPDLTFQSLEIMAVSGRTFEVWMCAGILYLLLGLVCSLAGKCLESHYSRATSQ